MGIPLKRRDHTAARGRPPSMTSSATPSTICRSSTRPGRSRSTRTARSTRLTTVWLPVQLLDKMAVAADLWKPLEAGGVLAGYWSTKHSEAIVTHVIDVGPRAEHRKDG